MSIGLYYVYKKEQNNIFKYFDKYFQLCYPCMWMFTTLLVICHLPHESRVTCTGITRQAPSNQVLLAVLSLRWLHTKSLTPSASTSEKIPRCSRGKLEIGY